MEQDKPTRNTMEQVEPTRQAMEQDEPTRNTVEHDEPARAGRPLFGVRRGEPYSLRNLPNPR